MSPGRVIRHLPVDLHDAAERMLKASQDDRALSFPDASQGPLATRLVPAGVQGPIAAQGPLANRLVPAVVQGPIAAQVCPIQLSHDVCVYSSELAYRLHFVWLSHVALQ